MTLTDWAPLFLICLLGAMSPGPSLAAVMSHTLHQGRSAGYRAALSHGLGVALYGLITVAGLAAMIIGSPVLFSGLQLAGAAYLLYLGFTSISASGRGFEAFEQSSASRHQAIVDGFLVAFLNPKLAVFMLALFSQFLTPDTSWTQRWTMVLTVGITDASWYSAVVMFLSRETVLKYLRQASKTLDRLLGAILILLALSMLASAMTRYI